LIIILAIVRPNAQHTAFTFYPAYFDNMAKYGLSGKTGLGEIHFVEI
jgi:hypothetical protein